MCTYLHKARALAHAHAQSRHTRTARMRAITHQAHSNLTREPMLVGIYAPGEIECLIYDSHLQDECICKQLKQRNTTWIRCNPDQCESSDHQDLMGLLLAPRSFAHLSRLCQLNVPRDRKVYCKTTTNRGKR